MTAHRTHPFKNWQWILPLLLFCTGGSSWAQVSNYSFSMSSPGYTPISATTVATATASSGVGSLDFSQYNVTLPFTFNFGNASYTTVNILTDGSVGFGTNNVGGYVAAFNSDLRGIFSTTAMTTTGNDTLQSLGSIGNVQVGQTIIGPGIKAGTTIKTILTNAIVMTDTATATTSTAVSVAILSGKIMTTTLGTAPTRTFVIQWSGFQFNGIDNYSIDFQVLLNEAGGVPANQTIQIVYGNSVNLSHTDAVQVGLRSANPALDFLMLTSTTNWTSAVVGSSHLDKMPFSPSNMPPAGLMYQFTPPPGCSGTPVAGTITALPNPVCAGNSAVLTLTGATYGTGSQLQWQTSKEATGTFTPIVWPSLNRITVPTAGFITYYKVVVTCLTSASSTTTATFTLPISNAPKVAKLPYRNSFETWTTTCATSDQPDTNMLVIPHVGNSAWRRNDQGATASWTSATTGAYSPVSSVGSFSARFHASQAAANEAGTLEGHFNFSTTGNKQINFDFINPAPGNDVFVVELSVDSGNTYTTLATLGTATSWTPRSIITSATGPRVIVRWRGVHVNGTSDFGIDNIYVTSCFVPTALNVSSVTATSANLGYTPAGSPIAYQIQWSTGNTFTPGSGTNVFTTTNPYSLTGLTGNTQYSYFVRQVCAAGDTSEYSSRFTFTTACGLYSLPYTENFTSYLPNVCWQEATGALNTGSVLTGTSSNWQAANYMNRAATNQAARLNLYTNTQREWLISSSINLGTPAAGNSFALEFDAGFVNLATTTPSTMGSDDSIAVVVSTDNGATWSRSNIVKLFTASNTPVGGAAGDQHFVIPLDGYSGTIRIGFYGSEGTVDDAQDYEAFFDNIRVASCTKPVVALGNDTLICPGNPLTLDAKNAGATYLWSTNATTQTISVSTAGTWNVTVTNATGCIGRGTITTTLGTNPTVNLGNDTSFCPGAAVTLDAGNAAAGTTYLWSNTATTRTITVNTAGTYTVTVTNSQKCFASDAVVIAAAVNPVVNLGNDTTVCPGSTITLDAKNPGSSYLYDNNATTQTRAVTTSGTYWVRVTNATKCISTDTINVYQGTNPVVNLGNDTLICPGNPLTLDAGNFGANFLYNTGATTQTISVSAAGKYWVRVSNGTSCVGSDTINVTLGTNPVVNFGNDTVLCPSVTKVLNAGNAAAGTTYAWSTSATTQTITVSTAGTYIVTVTNAQKCRGRDTINIYYDVNPVVNLGPDTAICPGATITLNAGNPGSSYLYNTGATTRTLNVTSGGTYSVRVTNVNKCVGRDTIVILQGSNPIVNLGNDTSVCDGIAFTVDAGNPGSTYLYNTGANTRTLSVTPAGVYWVTVTNAQKCIGRDTISVGMLPKAFVSTINQTKTAATVAFTSDAFNTTVYDWSFGDGATANTPNPSHTYAANGVYTVRVIVTNDCGSDTALTSVTISGVGVGGVSQAPAELKLYPNPSTGIVTLDNQSNLHIQSVSVVNALGSVVMQKDQFSNRKEVIDLSSLPAGNYLVRIHTNDGVFLHKLQLLK